MPWFSNSAPRHPGAPRQTHRIVQVFCGNTVILDICWTSVSRSDCTIILQMISFVTLDSGGHGDSKQELYKNQCWTWKWGWQCPIWFQAWRGSMAPSSTPSPLINRCGYWITKLQYHFSLIFFSSDDYTVKAQTFIQVLGPNYLMNRTIRYFFWPRGYHEKNSWDTKRVTSHENPLPDVPWAPFTRGPWIPTQWQ